MFNLDYFMTQLTVLLGWTGLVEWRIRTMQRQLESKISDREELTKYKVDELKKDVARLETKIDHLITLQLRRGIKNGSKD